VSITQYVIIGILTALYFAAVLLCKRIEVMEHFPDPFKQIEEALSEVQS